MNDNASRHSDSSAFRRDGSSSRGQQDAGNAAFAAPPRLQLNRMLHGMHFCVDVLRVIILNTTQLSESCPAYWSCVPFMLLSILYKHGR